MQQARTGWKWLLPLLSRPMLLWVPTPRRRRDTPDVAEYHGAAKPPWSMCACKSKHPQGLDYFLLKQESTTSKSSEQGTSQA